jgi:hypothetical protein
MGPVRAARWARDAIAPVLAAPFVALRPWATAWEQHGQPGSA